MLIIFLHTHVKLIRPYYLLMYYNYYINDKNKVKIT